MSPVLAARWASASLAGFHARGFPVVQTRRAAAPAWTRGRPVLDRPKPLEAIRAAVSTPAFAQSSSRSSARTIRDPVATEAIAPRPHSAASLAFKAQAELEYFVRRPTRYACIEQLLDPDRSSGRRGDPDPRHVQSVQRPLRLLNGEIEAASPSLSRAAVGARRLEERCGRHSLRLTQDVAFRYLCSC